MLSKDFLVSVRRSWCRPRLRPLSFVHVLSRECGSDSWDIQVKHKLDAVLQEVVEEDESRLVQEQARVLLRAIMVSALV